MYYCSVVSAQDLDGNNEAYAELIVLGEWGRAQRAPEVGGERELACLLSTLVCPPSVIQLGPVACFAPSLASHLGFSVPCAPDRTLPNPAGILNQPESK